MPKPESVQPVRKAGYVNTNTPYSHRRKKLEEEEKELEELEQKFKGQKTGEQEEPPQNTEGQEEEEDKSKNKSDESQQVDSQEHEEDDEGPEPTSKDEKTWKQRYGHLRRHSQKTKEELTARIEELEERMKDPTKIEPLKSDEDVNEWKKKYPDVAGIVEAVARRIADERVKGTEERLSAIDQKEAELAEKRAEETIRSSHKDWDDIRESDEFHDWAEAQPKWVQDALYENADDAKSVIRVVDLFKMDTGKTPSDQKNKTKEAAKSVGRTSTRTQVDVDASKDTIRESEIEAMDMDEFERREDEIEEARRKGKIIYDLSGGAR